MLVPNNLFQTGYELSTNICKQARNKTKLPINIQNSRLQSLSSVLAFGKYLIDAITTNTNVTIDPNMNTTPDAGIPNALSVSLAATVITNKKIEITVYISLCCFPLSIINTDNQTKNKMKNKS